MKKIFQSIEIILILLGFIIYPIKINAAQNNGNYWTCKYDYGLNGVLMCQFDFSSGYSCDTANGWYAPCQLQNTDNDCCNSYDENSCPVYSPITDKPKQDCVRATGPTPTLPPPKPTPTFNPINPLQCDTSNRFNCNTDQDCNGNEKCQPPAQAPGCHGVCVSATPMPTALPGGPSSFNPSGGCPNAKYVNTAIGCIPTNPQDFVAKILGLAVGIGGGIAFLLILFGGFQILTSAGNPEKLNAGKELITSAITGLLIIIFSLFILRLIGFNIFGIPGFG